MKRVMFDIETLSTRPDAAMIAVAVVIQDDDGSVPASRVWFIDTDLAIGHRNPETLEWWASQPEQVKSVVFSGNNTPKEALTGLTNFLRQHFEIKDEDYEVYGDPAAFDLPILKYQFEACGMELPWYWRRERCSDTIEHLFKDYDFHYEKHEPEVKHHPICDALASMRTLMSMLKTLATIREEYHQ